MWLGGSDICGTYPAQRQSRDSSSGTGKDRTSHVNGHGIKSS